MRRRRMNVQITNEFQITPRRKILLVDDDPVDLEYHAGVLEGQGHQVLTCRSYDEAVRLLDFGKFDLVVVSQGSAAFEGRAVLARAAHLTPPTPVLVIARVSDMRCYLDAIEMGAVDYVEKPVLPAEMRRLVRDHAGLHAVA